MSLGAYINQTRKSRGLSQREVADPVGVDVSYLSKIENDRLEHTPSSRILRALAAQLEVDEMDLLQRAGKLPEVLAPFAGDREALAFLRDVAATPPSSAGWR